MSSKATRSQRILKISSRIHLAERKTGIPHGARPGSRKMWIVCFRTNDHQPTTNIALEGFRRRFEAIWYRCQTQIFEAIQIQQSLHAFTLSQLQLGNKVHAREENNLGRIKRIICCVANYKKIDYSKVIGVNLSFYSSSFFGLVVYAFTLILILFMVTKCNLVS